MQDAAHLAQLGVIAPRRAKHAGTERAFAYRHTYALPAKLAR